MTAYLAAAVVATAGALLAVPAQASNPIVSRFAADPSMLVANDRMYIYATDDQSNDGNSWNSTAWRVYSSSDLTTWTDHGAPFSLSDFSWAENYAWAPSAVQREGYYYLYLPVDRAKIGVARSTSPTGGFTDPLQGPLIDAGRDANTGKEPIDPAAFVDDDGQAYLFFGGAGAPKVVSLNADMVSTSGDVQNVTIEGAGKDTGFAEAGFIHKRNDIYYLSYSTGWPGRIAYATATNPLGPFTYRGIVLDYTNNNTNHHSIAEFNGRWYISYHRKGLPGGSNVRRSLAMDHLDYNNDGTIRTVIQTSVGVGTPTLPINRVQSLNFPHRYVRHANFDARIDTNVNPVADGQWRIVPGLADASSEYVSFESVNFPGYYLRHRSFDFSLARNEGTSQYAADATFRRIPGLADETKVSFQSYNYPERYLRHFDYLLRLDPITDATGRADATFNVTE